MEVDPKNPYMSCILDASAGSGKTYQLAFRFLYLVAGGADPSKILTITFTKAAATEMKDRIVTYASKLLSDIEVQKEFEANLQLFQQRFNYNHYQYITPQKVAEYILDKVSELQILTIDSLFFKWIKKFLYETLLHEFEDVAIHKGWIFDFADSLDAMEFTARAWENLCVKHLDSLLAENVLLAELISKYGFLTFKNWVLSLCDHEIYVWFCKRVRNDKTYYNQVSYETSHFPIVLDFTDEIYYQLKPYLKNILNKSNPRNQIYQKLTKILNANSWQVFKSELLNSKDQISGKYFRGDFKNKCEEDINVINHLLNQFKKHIIDVMAQEILKVYDLFIHLRNREKYSKSLIEFSDLSKGCFNLFFDDANIGARFFINKNIQHILIDEFQDTNRLQWAIFEEICKEIISGDSVDRLSIDKNFYIKPTIFIVGDYKQSIYGFRDADPNIMYEAYNKLSLFDVHRISLSSNFRSAQIILDYVNLFFKERFDNFADHTTATINGSLVIPNYGQIIIQKPFYVNNSVDNNVISSSTLVEENVIGEDFEDYKAEELEAKYVAQTILEILKNKDNLVFDKNLKRFRSIEPRDCAVLYRANTKSEIFESKFREYGIPYYKEGSGGFFDRVEIKDMMALVKWLAFPTDIVSLLTVLKSPIVGVKDEDILQVISVDSTVIESNYILENIFNKYPKSISVVKHILEAVNQLILPHKILIYILYHLNILNKYKHAFNTEIDCELSCANILQFVELCIDLENKGCVTLSRLSAKLEELNKLACNDALNPGINNSQISSNAVRFMTIHKSKGLEFPLVFLVDCARDWDQIDRYWIKTKSYNGDFGVSFIGSKQIQPYEDKEFDEILQNIKHEIHIENLRVLYVALTRAQFYLLVSGHLNNKTSYDKTNLLFNLYECAKKLAQSQPSYHFTEIAGQIKIQAHLSSFIVKHDVDSKQIDKSILPLDTLSSYDISQVDLKSLNIFKLHVIKPHELISYEDSDKLYCDINGDWELYRNSITFKLSTRANLIYGTLIHKGLELAVKSDFKLKYEQFVSYALSFLYLNHYKFIEQDFIDNVYNDLQNIIMSESWKNLFVGSKNIFVEVPIVYSDTNLNFIHGVIDLLIEYSQEVWIIDYKTTKKVHDLQRFSTQLQAYSKAIESLYQNMLVKTKVFLTFNQIIYDI